MAATGLSLIDNALLKAAADGLSPQEMGTELGISAAKAVVRVKEILASRDVWSEIEQRQLLMVDLYKLKTILSNGLGDTKVASEYIKTINTIDKIMDKQGKITADELSTITRVQAQALLGLVQAAFGRAEELLLDRYPQVPLDEIREAFALGLREQALEATS